MTKNMLAAMAVIFVLGNLCRFGLPWWTVTPFAAVAIFLLPQRSGFMAFFTGLIAGAAVWGLAAWLADNANGGVLSAKVGELFQGVGRGGVLGITTLIGALLGAFGALTGQMAVEMTKTPKKNYYAKRKAKWQTLNEISNKQSICIKVKQRQTLSSLEPAR